MLYDIAFGTFTHRTENLPRLLDSVKKFHPNVPFIVQIADRPILENFEMLRQSFRATNKRFWIFLDDDIEFIQPVLNQCLISMMKNRWAMVGTYSTYDPDYDFSDTLIDRESGWMPGYFQMIDSNLIGHVTPDFNLPDKNTSIDTSYSVTIKSLGHKIGIAPVVVYHQYKTNNSAKVDIIETTNQYLLNKWGKFYFDCCSRFEGIVGKIPVDLMVKNRNYLIAKQDIEFGLVEKDKIKLNLGCGDTHYPGYINMDLYGDPDIKGDMRLLPYENETIDRINAQHILEHIPYAQFIPTLKEWYRVLKVDGILDIGIPDIELCCKNFLSMPESEKWRWGIATIFGAQTLPANYAYGDAEEPDYGQFHLGGLSLSELRKVLVALGFEIVESFNYDGNGTPSAYCVARKVN
jgi:hypothetical protein